jgi:metal-responsive CopG/Arc/MetJ family transcriptional regulator
MALQQKLVQLPDEMLVRLDERAAREGRSRSALIRDAIRAYLNDDVAAEIDRLIVEGYTRIPQTDDELAWAHTNAAGAVAAEPW